MKRINYLILCMLFVFATTCCSRKSQSTCHITAPQAGEAYMPQDSIVISINADNATKVRIFLDSVGLAECNKFPYNAVLAPKSQKIGKHTLVAVAEDKQGRKVADTISFFVGIGVEYMGGIIFDLDSTGEHGLIAAKQDLPGTYAWKTSGFLIGALDPDNGASNTSMVMESGYPSDAVKACAKYTATVNGTKYTDWYMPATNELVKMYENLYVNHIGNFGAKYYWASTEMGKYDSYTVFFYDGFVIRKNKYVSCSVRPIKAF